MRMLLHITLTTRSPSQAVRTRGAVIEVAAALVLGSPSATLLIDPSGKVKMVATMEQIFCPAYCAVGHSFPQTSMVHSALEDAATAVGQTLAASDVIGAALSAPLSVLKMLPAFHSRGTAVYILCSRVLHRL